MTKREMFYITAILLAILLLCIGLVMVMSDQQPTKTVTVHDNAPTTGCSLPIKVGQYGYIKKGDWSEFKAKVVGKVDNGVDCAYSVYIQPKKQNAQYFANEVYTNVNSDNLFPINGETIR